MEAKDVSSQFANLSWPVTSMAPHLGGGITPDRFDGEVGLGSGETSFELSDLKNRSSSGSPPLSSPPGSAPSRLSPSTEPPKKRRGRPPGARNRQKQLPPLNVLLGRTAADGFTPYFTTVKTGEDVLARVLSFPLNGAQGICILSAVGTVSNVTITPPGGHSSNSLTYQGLFEILSLSGSYVAADPRGKSKMGGLTISVAGTNGRVIGGAVAGIIAASPIQMVVGSFSSNNAPKLQKRKYTRREPLATQTHSINAPAGITTSSFHPDNNTTVPMPLLSISHGMVDAAAVVSGDTVASESPINLSAEDDNATTNIQTHVMKDVQNLNMRPPAPPPAAFDYGETTSRNNGLEEHLQNRWQDDINSYPGRQGQV